MLQKMEPTKGIKRRSVIVRKKWFDSVNLLTTDWNPILYNEVSWDGENAFVITRVRCKQNPNQAFMANLWEKDQNLLYTVRLS